MSKKVSKSKKNGKNGKNGKKSAKLFSPEKWIERFLRVVPFRTVLDFLTRDHKDTAKECDQQTARADFLKASALTAKASGLFKKAKKRDRGFKSFRWASYLADTEPKHEDAVYKAILKVAKDRAKGKGKDTVSYRRALPLLEKAHYWTQIVKNVPAK